MTTVQKARESLVQAIGLYGVTQDKGMPHELSDAIDLFATIIRSDEREGIAAEAFLFRDMNTVLQIGYCSVIPTAELNSVLSPTEPEVKPMTPDEAAAQHKMVEEFTKNIDDIMIQAINFRPAPKEEKPMVYAVGDNGESGESHS